MKVRSRLSECQKRQPGRVGLVADVMSEWGLKTVQPRTYRLTTIHGDEEINIEDVINRDFTSPDPGTRLVSDITYLRTYQRWLYLAIVLDLSTRMIIGWQMDTHTSNQFAKYCRRSRITPSMGRTSICWDNAAVESFFATLKNEMYYRYQFTTRTRARFAVAEYIEVFYNRKRVHSSLGYRTPSEMLAHYYAENIAA